MLYMLQIYLLVAVPVFALTGALILARYSWTKLQEYVGARRAMKRIVMAATTQHRAA